MPTLEREIDIYPENLLQWSDESLTGSAESVSWWALYTLSRREKQLMRKLHALNVPFYSPVIRRRYRSPNGRVRTSWEPLFANYVFVYGDDSNRCTALTTNCVSKWMAVPDPVQLQQELERIHRLIAMDRPLAPESRLIQGDVVRVRTGAFAGFEGTVIRREGALRLLVAVNFTHQGVSVLLDDCQLEPV